jgi:ABC-type antimicrobial peptide transport system permease subunit
MQTLLSSLALAIITWSVAGFVILFGVLTLLPIIYDILMLKRPSLKERVGLVRRYSFRFISRFTKGVVIGVLVASSLFFLFAGLSTLLYLGLDWNLALGISFTLTIVATLSFIVLIFIVGIHALSLEEEEFEIIQNYVPPKI